MKQETTVALVSCLRGFQNSAFLLQPAVCLFYVRVPRSLTAKAPEKFPSQERQTSSTIFSGRAVKLRWCKPKFPKSRVVSRARGRLETGQKYLLLGGNSGQELNQGASL